jgi:hypothetical protein
VHWGWSFAFYQYYGGFLEIALVDPMGFGKQVLFCFFFFEKNHPRL